MSDSPWLTVRAAAAYTGISVTTIRRCVARGELRAYRIASGRLLRFHRDDVDAWMRRAAAA